MLNLFPLFPGKNEKDQIHKIHNILGTPPREILERFKRCTHKLNYTFSHVTGTGLAPLLSRSSPECLEIICRMLAYNPDERITAKQTLNSPYFKDQRTQDQSMSMLKEPSGSTSAISDHTGDGLEHLKKSMKDEYPYKKKPQQGMPKITDHASDCSNSNSDDPNNNVRCIN